MLYIDILTVHMVKKYRFEGYILAVHHECFFRSRNSELSPEANSNRREKFNSNLTCLLNTKFFPTIVLRFTATLFTKIDLKLNLHLALRKPT